MSKAHRGKGIREMLSRGRGLCALCGKDRIKALYEQEIGGEKKMICKFCKAAVKNGKTV